MIKYSEKYSPKYVLNTNEREPKKSCFLFTKKITKS